MASIEEISPNNLEAYMDLIPEVLKEQAAKLDGFRFYGIEEAGEASGVVCLVVRADEAEIKYVYVLPYLRGTGIIDQMLAYLFVELREEGFNYVTFRYVPQEYPFFKNLAERFGFEERMLDYAYFKFKVGDIERCKAASFSPQGIIRFKYLPPEKKNSLFKMVEKSMKMYDFRLPSNEDILPYSLAYIENDSPKGALVVDKPGIVTLPTSDDIKRYPEPGALDLTLFFVGTRTTKAPLYLLSGLCKVATKEFPPGTTMTGFFPESHVVSLIEGALNIKGFHEVKATLDLNLL